MTHECGRGGKGGGGGGTEIPNRKTTHRHKQSKNQRLGPQAIFSLVLTTANIFIDLLFVLLVCTVINFMLMEF